jgi:hypothetical protein
VTAAHGLEQSALNQRLYQLEEKELGDRVRPGDVGDPAQARIVDRAVDQRADSKLLSAINSL